MGAIGVSSILDFMECNDNSYRKPETVLIDPGKLINELFEHDFFKKDVLKNILILFFLASFIMTPLKSSI